jgi:hypothetical protein
MGKQACAQSSITNRAVLAVAADATQACRRGCSCPSHPLPNFLSFFPFFPFYSSICFLVAFSLPIPCVDLPRPGLSLVAPGVGDWDRDHPKKERGSDQLRIGLSMNPQCAPADSWLYHFPQLSFLFGMAPQHGILQPHLSEGGLDEDKKTGATRRRCDQQQSRHRQAMILLYFAADGHIVDKTTSPTRANDRQGTPYIEKLSRPSDNGAPRLKIII